jgi:hypothetical protein
VDTSARGFLILGNNGENQIRAGRTTTGGYIDFYTNNTVAQTTLASDGNFVMRLAASGNVGIGTTSPGAKLQVDVSSASGIRVNGTGGYANILSQGGHLEFYKDSTPTYAAAIGLSTPATALSNDIQFATYNGSSWSARMTIANGGNVGIGTTSPISKLNLYGSGSNLSVFKVDGGNGTLFEVTDQLSGSLFSVNTIAGLPVMEVFSNNKIVMGTYGSNALVVSGSNVGIGTSTTSTYKLQVNGSFGATSKSFLIKHPDPAKPDKQLQHGVTEGPEHSVFVRGKLTNNNTIDLPDYWPYLVDNNTITVTITPIGSYQQLYVQSVENNTVTIANNNNMPINCYYYVVGERKDIPKLIVQP